jgi:hypothetical protein
MDYSALVQQVERVYLSVSAEIERLDPMEGAKAENMVTALDQVRNTIDILEVKDFEQQLKHTGKCMHDVMMKKTWTTRRVEMKKEEVAEYFRQVEQNMKQLEKILIRSNRI